MIKPEECRNLTPEHAFFSNTRAQVSVVSVPGEQQRWVRKYESEIKAAGSAAETTQPVAVFMDHQKFRNAAKLVSVSRCKLDCVGSCNYSPLIEGRSLNDILGLDQSGIIQVDTYRQMLLESMRSGGYFDQQCMDGVSEFYRGRYGKSFQEAVTSPRAWLLQLGGNGVRDIAIVAYHFLTETGLQAPLGMFPNDLNLTNIFVRSSDNELRVIDQAMSFTSPSVVICKLIVGWRGLVTLVRTNPDWSTVSANYPTSHLDKTLELDTKHIQNCLAFYNRLPLKMISNLQREIAAVQIMKTFVTLVRYQEKGVLPPTEIIDQVVAPFFNNTLNDFYMSQSQTRL